MVNESARSYLDEHFNPSRSESVLAFISDLPVPEGDIFEIFEEAEDSAARRVNPDMPPFAYLTIRLTGHAVSGGGVNHEIANDLLGPIGAEIQAAAGPQAKESEMTLVRISRGSLVLHYKPTHALAEIRSGQVEKIEVSPVDQAIRDTFELHNMLETNEASAAIASRFGGNQKLLKAARTLTESLDKHDLNMKGKWRSPLGGRVESAITENGRTYARGIFKKIDKPETKVITGRITALDIDGIITIQQSGDRKRRVHLDDPAVITTGDFVLGETVTLHVEIVENKDQLGLSGRQHLKFINQIIQSEFIYPSDDSRK